MYDFVELFPDACRIVVYVLIVIFVIRLLAKIFKPIDFTKAIKFMLHYIKRKRK